MTRKFEKCLDEALEELHNYQAKNDEELVTVQRTKAILAAIKGYMSEGGTFYSEDVLLRWIGIQPSRTEADELSSALLWNNPDIASLLH